MKALGATTVGIAGCCLGLATCSAQKVSTFSGSNEVFFKEEAFTGSSYVHFQTNGTYRRIAREHMFVEESDRGMWTQTSLGLITMQSSMHYRNIEVGPLAIWTWHTNISEKLPQIHAIIRNLLTTNNAKQFESDFIGERLVLFPSRGTNFYSPISVDYKSKQISRSELSSLMQAIEVFTNRIDNNHFHVAPMEYKGFTFLLWQDAETPFNRNLSEIKKSIDNLKEKRNSPPLVYVAIDKKTFDEEANRTQAFIFHPEMNQPRKQPSGDRK